MSIEFIESEMRFGPFQEENCFRMEQSGLYRRIQDGLKIPEFVLLRSQPGDIASVWIVEAKTSVPREGERLNQYMGEIREKLTNAIQIIFAGRLLRHPEAIHEFPRALQEFDLQAAGFKCVLVINGAPKQYMAPLQSALAKEMGTIVKTLGLDPDSVAVINDEQARNYRLIV
jgi:hypothetical protein